MEETQPIPAPNLPADTAPDSATTADPLARLHRMSTTAGVSSQQYVAVNNAAVFAGLLGLGSALAILGPVLLVIPLAGIVVSVVAWRQIMNSAGTETGKPLAVLGLLLSLAFGIGVIVSQVRQNGRARADAEAGASLALSMVDDVRAGRYDQAYARTSRTFRERVDRPTFEMAWRNFLGGIQPFGGIKSLAWNGVLPRYYSVATEERVFEIETLVTFGAGNAPGRLDVQLRNEPVGLTVENIAEIFPERKKGR